MRQVRAIVYGVGAMGVVATRYMLEKGVCIVGAISRSPEKLGRDLGDVAGLGFPTGVTVEGDADQVLGSRAADIAVVCVSSYMSGMYEHLRRCVEHGVNALTIAEELLYPWNTSPMETAELDRLAQRHGVTISATGQQDTYWVNLVTTWMGTAHRIDEVVGKASWNVEDYGPAVAHDQQVGHSVEEFDEWLKDAARPPSFGRNTLGAITADLGLSVTEMKTTTRPDLADREMESKSLGITVPVGHVIGFTDVDTFATSQGMKLTFEMSGRLYREGEADTNDWTIRGEPDLRLLNPGVPTGTTTVTQLVNRIPDVINAPPGFLTVEKLQPLRYRAFPLGQYVDWSGQPSGRS